MKRKKSFYLPFRFSACKSFFSIWLFLMVGLNANSQDSALTIISNLKGAPENMTMAELRSVLKGEKQRWSNKEKTKVTIAMMNTTTPIGKNACLKIYYMDPDAVAKFWTRLAFDHIAIVKTFISKEDLEKYIAQNPGTIGVTGRFSDAQDIKVILIDGKKTF